MSEELDDLIVSMGQGSKKRRVVKSRKRTIVKRTTIEFSAEIFEVLDRYMAEHRQRFIWEAVYDAVRCLAEKEGYNTPK